jgi:hypothetical protein
MAGREGEVGESAEALQCVLKREGCLGLLGKVGHNLLLSDVVIISRENRPVKRQIFQKRGVYNVQKLALY